jgi:hypothetical protein
MKRRRLGRRERVLWQFDATQAAKDPAGAHRPRRRVRALLGLSVMPRGAGR